MKTKTSKHYPISTTNNGVEHSGYYSVERGLANTVHVFYRDLTKATQIGANAENTARLLLFELIRQYEEENPRS
jgi:hypothetical protein